VENLTPLREAYAEVSWYPCRSLSAWHGNITMAAGGFQTRLFGMPRWLVLGSTVLAGLAVGLLLLVEFRSSPIRPVSWRPTPVLAEWRNLAATDILANPSRFECSDKGPESIAVNPQNGDLVTGFADGAIHLISGRDGLSRTVANTKGVPLGLGFLADSSLVVADAMRGLLHVEESGNVTVLSTESEGIPLRYPDGLVVDTTSRNVYFTDLSTRFGPGPVTDFLELVEHSGTGRLLRYDTQTRRTTTLLSGLQCANGVALGPGDAYVVVNETCAYRIQQYWLSGPMAGHSRLFADGLPGFPDNITFNGRDKFWVGIPVPRDRLLDGLAGAPLVRRLLTQFLVAHIAAFPREPRVLALDLSGSPVARLEGQGPHVYAPITEAHEVGSRLILAADAPCLASVPLPAQLLH
jgi:sugar lactone lactonase YvrE